MTKQVIVMRKDLNMRKGKMIAQGAHASVMVCVDIQSQWCPDYGFSEVQGGPEFDEWMGSGMTKICVGVDSEADLIDIYEKAKRSGIACALVQDAGHTEFAGVPTYTCCAVGPDTDEKVDEITGSLKLL